MLMWLNISNKIEKENRCKLKQNRLIETWKILSQRLSTKKEEKNNFIQQKKCTKNSAHNWAKGARMQLRTYTFVSKIINDEIDRRLYWEEFRIVITLTRYATTTCGLFVTSKTDKNKEWSPVHKTWQWAAPNSFYTNQITSEWEGSRGHVGMRLHCWRNAYKICWVLPISTRCIFFLLTHSIRIPQLSVLDLE